MMKSPTAIMSTLMSTAKGFDVDVDDVSADNDSAFFGDVTTLCGVFFVVTFSLFVVSLTSFDIDSSLGGVSGAESPSP